MPRKKIKRRRCFESAMIQEEGGQRGWNELPLEVKEMILVKLDNRNDLLSVRLVSKYWNVAATSVIQRRCLKNAIKWKSLDQSRFEMFPTSFPRLELKEENGLNMAYYPEQATPLRRRENPFVSNSLVLSPYCDSVRDFVRSKIRKRRFKFRLQLRFSLHQLLKRHGGCLTSLDISYLKTDTTGLYNLLQQMPNLKALTFSHLKLKGVEADVSLNETTDSLLASPVPNLTHAVLVGCSSVTLFRWLLKLFAYHLTSLYLDYRDGILPLSQTIYSNQTEADVIPFQQLNNLKIVYTCGSFNLNKCYFPSLRCLLIDHPWTDLSFDKLVQCLDKLAPLLVDLVVKVRRLNVENSLSGDFVTTSSKLCRALTFPRLSRFVLQAQDFKSYKLVKIHLLPRFTNLNNLLLPKFNRIGEYLGSTMDSETDWETAFIDRQRLWTLCPTLKTIGIPSYTSSGSFRFHGVLYRSIKRPNAMNQYPFLLRKLFNLNE